MALLLKNCSLLQLLQQYLFRCKCDSALCFEVSFSVLVSKQCILPGECTLHWSQWENERKCKQWERGRCREWTELFLGVLTGKWSLRPMLNWCLIGTPLREAREKENERQERQGQFCITQVSYLIWLCTKVS